MPLNKSIFQIRSESDKFINLDGLRFVASLGIVVSHYAIEIKYDHYQQILSNITYFHMFVDVFFVISGVIISQFYVNYISSYSKFGSFLKKRIARLLPLHWITLVFYVFVGLFGGYKISPERYDLACLLPNAFLLHSYNICHALTFNNVSWSISAEFGVYLLFPLVAASDRLWRWSSVVLFAIVIAILWMQPTADTSDLWYERTYNWGVIRAFPGFLLGCAAYTHRGAITNIAISPKILATISFGLCILGSLAGFAKQYLVLMAYAGTVCIYACDLQSKVGKVARVIAPGGVLTYSIYMLHPVVGIAVIKILAERILHLHGLMLNIVIVSTIPIAILVSYISYVAFETPARSWVSRLRLSRKVTDAL